MTQRESQPIEPEDVEEDEEYDDEAAEIDDPQAEQLARLDEQDNF